MKKGKEIYLHARSSKLQLLCYIRFVAIISDVMLLMTIELLLKKLMFITTKIKDIFVEFYWCLLSLDFQR